MGATLTVPKKEIHWTATLIRMLRGKRTMADLGKLLGVPKNTVWRWEADYAAPDSGNARRLSALAEKERFLADWKLAGSGIILGDLEAGDREIQVMFRRSLERTAKQLLG